jgi:cysteine desulfurase
MLTLSSHKIEGPKGVGALVIDEGVIKARGLSPLIYGGGQEGGLRSGTENVPGIAAFGEAVKLGAAECREAYFTLCQLRKSLVLGIAEDEALSEVIINEPPVYAPHIVNLTLPGIKSETMLHFLSSEGIFVSSGSACSSNSAHLSSALLAFGKTEAEADCSIRVSLSKRNTYDDVQAFLIALKAGLSRLARIKK